MEPMYTWPFELARFSSGTPDWIQNQECCALLPLVSTHNPSLSLSLSLTTHILGRNKQSMSEEKKRIEILYETN